MTDSLQYGLFQDTWEQRFYVWRHTPAGGQVTNRFIRIAHGLKLRGKKAGSKAIMERLRWNYETRRDQKDKYKINNNFSPYLARFAMTRDPVLAGYFDLHTAGDEGHNRRAVVVPIRKRKVS